ncbi:hypothetical protein FACS18942_06980 [Planctomycetales bacterium]|nr:hypothetical protein FACS18942_06980 [Planctomycetales bacterium]
MNTLWACILSFLGITGSGNKRKSEPLAYSVKKLPPRQDVQNKRCVVCKDGEFKLTTDETPPNKLNSGEVCWVVPKEPVEIAVQLPAGKGFVKLQTNIQFETDRLFAQYAADKNEITNEDLSLLIVAAWNSLLHTETKNFTELQNKEYRSKLNSFTVLHGFRCVRFAASWNVSWEEKTANAKQQESKQPSVALETEQFWNNDALRLRIENEYAAELTPLTSPEIEVPLAKKKPWLLFTFQQKSIDAKLLSFLSANIGNWAETVDTFESKADVHFIAALIPAKYIIKRLAQHLETLPRLMGKHSSFQSKQVPLKETVAAVQRTVPLAEDVNKQLRELFTETIPQDKFTEKVKVVYETLSQLETEIQTRKNIYAAL